MDFILLRKELQTARETKRPSSAQRALLSLGALLDKKPSARPVKTDRPTVRQHRHNTSSFCDQIIAGSTPAVLPNAFWQNWGITDNTT